MPKLPRGLWPVLVVLLVFAAYVCYPVATMVAQSLMSHGSFSFTHYRDLFDLSTTANIEAAGNSILVSILSVLFSGLVGVFLAVVFTQLEFPLKNILAKLAVLPIALPPLVGVIAFLFVFGESGILPRVFKGLLQTTSVPFSLGGIPAIVVIHVYSFSVYFYLLVSESLRRLDGSVLEAATNLRASPWTVFRCIILPHLRPALIGASALTFMASMASFSAPLIFAGSKRFITLEIYASKLNGDLDRAAAQSVLLLLLSVAFFAVLALSRGSEAVATRTRGAIRPGTLALGSRTRRVVIGMALVILFFEILPILTIILISFAREGSWTTQNIPPAYTLQNYTRLVLEPKIFEPIGNSLLIALVTLATAVLFGTTASYATLKGGMRGARRFWDILLTMPYAIPGTVVAVSLILAFNRPVLPAGYSILIGSFWILPLAYFIRMYPLILRSTSAALEQVDDSLLEAAESFGAGPGRRFRRILLPLVFPAVVSGGLLVVISSLGEFVSSILLYSYSNRPISIEILSQVRTFSFGGATAYSVVLLAIILLLGLGAGRLVPPSTRDKVSIYR